MENNYRSSGGRDVKGTTLGALASLTPGHASTELLG